MTTGAVLCALSLVFLIPTALMANEGVEDLEGLEFDTSVFYFDSIISKNSTNEFTLEYIDEVVKNNTVVLFMKGSPAQPQCGFSATAAGILQGYGVDIHHVDILIDPEVRQGVKEYSNWPTLPQIYVGGEFLGGSDILRQMHDQGELGEVIEEAKSGE